MYGKQGKNITLSEEINWWENKKKGVTQKKDFKLWNNLKKNFQIVTENRCFSKVRDISSWKQNLFNTCFTLAIQNILHLQPGRIIRNGMVNEEWGTQLWNIIRSFMPLKFHYNWVATSARTWKLQENRTL